MNTMDIIIRLLEATALGALIGLEREVVSNKIIPNFKNAQTMFWGLRSYTLMALLGAVSVYLGSVLWDVSTFVIFTGSVLFLFILASYIYSSFHQHQFGVTSEFAAVAVFLLGVLVMTGELQIAVFLAILIAIMLNYKKRIEPLIDKIGEDEISTTLKFAVIALIILPLLPDTKYALYDMMSFLPETVFTTAPFFNPYSIWFFVVVMSAVSYAGYILSKMVWANRGIIFSGALGGLVSSTAVTSAMAEKSHQHEKDNTVLYATVIATIAAGSIMFFRVLGIVMLFNPALLSTLFFPIFTMIIASIWALWWLWWKSKTHETAVQVSQMQESPFQVWPALKFAGLIILIKFTATLALSYRDYFGEWSLYIVSLISWLADVDAITQDMAERSALLTGNNQALSNLTATVAIIIAVVMNTLVKMGLAHKFGSPGFSRLIKIILWIVLLSGVVVLILVGIL